VCVCVCVCARACVGVVADLRFSLSDTLCRAAWFLLPVWDEDEDDEDDARAVRPRRIIPDSRAVRLNPSRWIYHIYFRWRRWCGSSGMKSINTIGDMVTNPPRSERWETRYPGNGGDSSERRPRREHRKPDWRRRNTRRMTRSSNCANYAWWHIHDVHIHVGTKCLFNKPVMKMMMVMVMMMKSTAHVHRSCKLPCITGSCEEDSSCLTELDSDCPARLNWSEDSENDRWGRDSLTDFQCKLLDWRDRQTEERQTEALRPDASCLSSSVSHCRDL